MLMLDRIWRGYAGVRTKRPKEYNPASMPKYAAAVSQVERLKIPLRTSPQLNFSAFSLWYISNRASNEGYRETDKTHASAPIANMGLSLKILSCAYFRSSTVKNVDVAMVLGSPTYEITPTTTVCITKVCY
jgi:hypothetical protein